MVQCGLLCMSGPSEQNQNQEMSATRSSRRGSPLLPEMEKGGFASPAQPGAAAQSSSQGPAPFVQSKFEVNIVTPQPQASNKRKHSEATEEYSAHPDTSGQGLQVVDNASKGTLLNCLAL